MRQCDLWDPSILSSEDSPASQSRSRDLAEEPMTPGGSGPRCCASSEQPDPLGCSLRTSLASGLSELTRCSVTWRRKATPAGRAWWVLVMSVPPTGETESGSWGTATCGAHNGVGREGQEKGSRLIDQVLWPTAPATAHPGVSLTDAVGGGQQARMSPSTNGSSPGQRLWRRWTQARLNPRWVAGLMGYPSDWLDGVRASE
jgi:hypothetical protein